LHQSFLASGAPNAFFATEFPTPSKGEHIHLTFFAGVVLCTLPLYLIGHVVSMAVINKVTKANTNSKVMTY